MRLKRMNMRLGRDAGQPAPDASPCIHMSTTIGHVARSAPAEAIPAGTVS